MNPRLTLGILASTLLVLAIIYGTTPIIAQSPCTTITPSDQSFGATITAAVAALSDESIIGSINAIGCDVGVYIGPGVTGVTISATVHDANQVGVFNDGGSANVTDSTIYNIGNHVNGVFTPNGLQTGIGVYYSATATGAISGNTIYNYQKGGIVVRDLDSVYVTNNLVTGLGPFNLIAQNGIEIGFGANGPTLSTSNVGHVTGNVVTDNIYTQGAGPAVSTGILAEAVSGSNQGSLVASLHNTNTVFRNQVDIIVVVG